MNWPSLTTVLSVLFLGYMANSLWSIASLYIPPSCPTGEKKCISSILTESSELSLIIFTTTKVRPSMGKDLSFLESLDVKVSEEKQKVVNVKFPKSVINNGTMYMCIFAVPKLGKVDKSKSDWWEKEIYNPATSFTQTRLTQYSIPVAETFNLLGEENKKEDSKPTDRSRPVSHLRSKIVITVMSDQVVMGPGQVPGEIGHTMSLTKDRKKYLPILFVDELTMRLRDLRVVNSTDTNSDIEVIYKPISFGKLRLFLQFSGALGSMHGMGFTDKDTDEVKGIFADTNLVLLLITFAVSAVHLLFDFLAFKSDVSFWRGKKTVEGLSRKTILWRAFSQTVIFFYLMDEETSLLVLIPGEHLMFYTHIMSNQN